MDIKRTEKLVSAIYLLTSFFDEKEPMKWRLRELGGRLAARQESQNIVLEIISLLQIGKNAGLISDTNFGIISPEFRKLMPAESLGELFATSDSLRVEAPLVEEKAESKPDYVASSLPQNYSARVVVKDRSKEAGPVTVKRNSRQSTILGLIKKKKEIMIKDVSPLIPGVSEKTIQRELLSMVHTGILRKIGEKRWSRYALAE